MRPSWDPLDVIFGASYALGEMPNPTAFPVTVSNQRKVNVNDVLVAPAQDTSSDKNQVLLLCPYSNSQIVLLSFTQRKFVFASHLCGCFPSFCVFYVIINLSDKGTGILFAHCKMLFLCCYLTGFCAISVI